jgi:ABC-2 type transport system ATP-binding protein
MATLLRSRASCGAAVVFSSHQLDLVEDLCDDVVLIDDGRLVLEGPLGEVRSRAGTRVVEATFAEPTTWCPMGQPAAALTPPSDAPASPAVTISAPVPADADLAALVASARSAGRVTGFTFRPPTLAEIFRNAVRR